MATSAGPVSEGPGRSGVVLMALLPLRAYGSAGATVAVSARRCRRLTVIAAVSAASAAAVRITSGRIPAWVAGVEVSDSVSVFWMTAAVLNSVACQTVP